MAGPGVCGVVAVLVGIAGGCGPEGDAAAPAPQPPVSAAPGPAANRAPITAPAGQGTIVGTVMRDGGRDPRSGGRGEATGSVPVGADPVQVRDEGGKVVARAVSSSDGTFELALPPGNYVVSEDISSVSQRVRVAAEAVTTVTLLVPGA